MEEIIIQETFRQEIVNAKVLSIEYSGYFISEHSNVYSNKRGKFKILTKDGQGYVKLKVAGKTVNLKWYKLMMKTFKPSEPEKRYVTFIDMNPENTHYSNMQWSDERLTYKTMENMEIEENVVINGEKINKNVEIRHFGYNGYFISEYGKPYSLKIKELTPLKIHERKGGYDYVQMNYNKKMIPIDINLAVAKAFIPIEKELPYVLFKDKNVYNKHYTNLYWSSTCEEIDDEFATLEGYSKYKFNKMGVCKSYKGKYPKILQPSRNEHGYFFYCLIGDKGEQKQLKRGRTVATIFIPNPENKPHVDHLNRDRGDDRLENLSWATVSENNANRDYETIVDKLNRKVAKFDKNGIFLKEYKNGSSAAEDIQDENILGIPHSINCCAWRNEKKTDSAKYSTAYGYVWRYTDEEKKYELLPGEELIPIKNDEMESSFYITNFLNIINKKGNKMRFHIHGGYPHCCIKINGKQKFVKMHRLVGIFFVEGRTEERNIINHIDENKLNYHPSNLEWVTSSENSLHSSYKRRKPIDQFDENSGVFIKRFLCKKEAAETIKDAMPDRIRTACYTKTIVYKYAWRYADLDVSIPDDLDIELKTNKKSVDQFTLEGKFVKRYESISSAIKETGYRNISACCNNGRGKAGNFLWKHADINKEPCDIETREKNENQYPMSAVIQKTRGGVFVKRHDNIFKASENIGISAKRINEGCIGKYNSVANYNWGYDNQI